MRFLFMIAIPVLVISIVLLFTVLGSWTTGYGLCGTWMEPIWPFCR
jgi:hypothetical protein